MSELKVTLIDVGWGDSILIEASAAGGGRPRFALIDSNDNADRDYWPAWNFLRKHFGRREGEFDYKVKPLFDFVLLTHDHSDHGSGLKRIMKEYGTQRFWYPLVVEDESVVVTSLQNYADHHMVNIPNQAVDTQDDLGTLGEAQLQVLWPPPDTIDADPNNNSVVLLITLNDVNFLLTGDAEGPVWQQIADRIPDNTRFVKVPHHGSRNGSLNHGATAWLERVEGFANPPRLGISCHPNYPNRYDFPHADVLARFAQGPCEWQRTDDHYHVTYVTDGQNVRVKYSHET